MQAPPSLRVEAAGGLVEKKQRGIIDEGKRKGEALAFSAGKSFETSAGFVLEREAFEKSGSGDGARVKCREQVERLAWRDGILKGGGLKDRPDAPLDRRRMRASIQPGDLDRAGIRKPEPQGAFDDRGFARADWAQESEYRRAQRERLPHQRRE